jgi:hypothetical protein
MDAFARLFRAVVADAVAFVATWVLWNHGFVAWFGAPHVHFWAIVGVTMIASLLILGITKLMGFGE